MKWFNVLTITLLIFAMVNIAGAQINIGLVGGLNYSNFKAQKNNPFDVNPDDFHKRQVYGFGAVVEYELNNTFSLCTVPMFLQKRSFYQEEVDEKQTYTLSYLELPVLIKIAFGQSLKPYIFAGPSIGYCLGGNVRIEADAVTGEGSLNDIVEKLDPGVGFGGGISWDLGICTLFIEGRYSFGLRNINKGGTVNVDIGGITIPQEVDPLEVKTYGTQIMVGVTLPIQGDIL